MKLITVVMTIFVQRHTCHQFYNVWYPDLFAKRVLKTETPSDTKPQYVVDHTSPHHELVVDIPDYDIRRLAAARDPLAVVEAHRLNICLRLAWLLGVRMCPNCPRCNDRSWGCQDLYGSNMRPTGGVLGGTPAFEVGTEHQGKGTPHAHGQTHIICRYQFGTLKQIAEEIRTAWPNTALA
jgi:hypothetical protein